MDKYRNGILTAFALIFFITIYLFAVFQAPIIPSVLLIVFMMIFSFIFAGVKATPIIGE